MWQVWEYETYDGTHRGVMAGFSDRGGTDVTYRFHRLGADGRRIEYDNGGLLLDSVSGSLLKQARHIGAMQPHGTFSS